MNEIRTKEMGRTGLAPLHRSDFKADDMERVARRLDELADALSEDMALIVRLSEEVQALDIAAQMLRKLALQQDRD